MILISSTCGGLHLSHPKIIGVAPYRRCLLGKWASGIRGSRDAEKLKASQDEWAEVQKDEEEYDYHDGHQYEVGSTHNTRPSVAYFLPTDTLSLPIGLPQSMQHPACVFGPCYEP